MSDSANGSAPPAITTTPPKSQGQAKGQRTPSAVHNKRNNRNNNNNNNINNNTTVNNARKSNPRIDGAVSDSVTSMNAHAPTKRLNTQGQGGLAAYPQYSTYQNGDVSNQRARPASMGGPMIPGTPAKERAYAQSTFQASPAASALPVPKFFGSKSVPNVNVPSSLQARMDGEKTPEEPQGSSPESDVVSPAKRTHNSSQTPLDMFFMADKAEKERNSPANMSPDLAVRPPPASEPRNPFQTNRPTAFARGIHEAEGPMISPRTVSDGLRPSHPSRAHSSPGNPIHQTGNNEVSTQALKDLLFNNINNKPNSTPPRTHQRAPSNSTGVDSCFETPSPVQRAAAGPTTPTPGKHTQDQYSLHYGNRNLSPMFQAARNETPPRPSNLRQQLNHSGQQNGFPQYNQQQPFSNHSDPNAFSRSYLDSQIRSSLPAQPPSGLISNGNNGTSSASLSGPSSNYSAPQHSMPVPGASGSPRNSGTRDMKGMEDDLRRMLNLNVLG
jgi:hypothetical protein